MPNWLGEPQQQQGDNASEPEAPQDGPHFDHRPFEQLGAPNHR